MTSYSRKIFLRALAEMPVVRQINNLSDLAISARRRNIASARGSSNVSMIVGNEGADRGTLILNGSWFSPARLAVLGQHKNG